MSTMALPNERTQGVRQAMDALASARVDRLATERIVASTDDVLSKLRAANADPDAVTAKLRTIIRGER